jgi:hypothetical protein
VAKQNVPKVGLRGPYSGQPIHLPGIAVPFVLRTITSRGRYSSGTVPIMGSRSGAQGASPTNTPFRHFRYAFVYGLLRRRGEVRVPRNTLGLVIAVLVIILLIYLILQFI